MFGLDGSSCPCVSSGALLPEQGPAGSAYSLRLPATQGVVFSKKSKNVEAAMKFFNWGVKNSTNRNTIDFGMQNVHWEWLDENKGMIKKMEGSEIKYSG